MHLSNVKNQAHNKYMYYALNNDTCAKQPDLAYSPSNHKYSIREQPSIINSPNDRSTPRAIYRKGREERVKGEGGEGRGGEGREGEGRGV